MCTCRCRLRRGQPQPNRSCTKFPCGEGGRRHKLGRRGGASLRCVDNNHTAVQSRRPVLPCLLVLMDSRRVSTQHKGARFTETKYTILASQRRPGAAAPRPPAAPGPQLPTHVAREDGHGLLHHHLLHSAVLQHVLERKPARLCTWVFLGHPLRRHGAPGSGGAFLGGALPPARVAGKGAGRLAKWQRDQEGRV